MLKNLGIILKSKYRTSLYILLVILSTYIWWNNTDIDIMFGNYGYLHTYTDIILSILIIILFPLFLITIGYKSLKYGKRTDMVGETSIGVIGGTIGVMISGASCCGATLAASFGLLPLMSFLPYDGLELKIVGTLGLLYALFDVIKNLDSCKTKK